MTYLFTLCVYIRGIALIHEVTTCSVFYVITSGINDVTDIPSITTLYTEEYLSQWITK